MTFCPADTAAPLSDFGVPVVVDRGPTTSGWLLSALAYEREYGVALPHGEDVLHVATGSVGALVTDQRLQVDGLWYRYRGPADGPRDRYQRLRVAREVGS